MTSSTFCLVTIRFPDSDKCLIISNESWFVTLLYKARYTLESMKTFIMIPPFFFITSQI